MPKKKKSSKSKAAKKKTSARKIVVKSKRGYYDKFDEKEYSGPELSVKRDQLKSSGKVLKHLEEDIVKQNDEEIPLEHIADEEESLTENPKAVDEGLGIEEEEKKGEEPYPEIAEAEKDPDEEEEE